MNDGIDLEVFITDRVSFSHLHRSTSTGQKKKKKDIIYLENIYFNVNALPTPHPPQKKVLSSPLPWEKCLKETLMTELPNCRQKKRRSRSEISNLNTILISKIWLLLLTKKKIVPHTNCSRAGRVPSAFSNTQTQKKSMHTDGLMSLLIPWGRSP